MNPENKTLLGAREQLREWLRDLEALRSFVDPGNPDANDFGVAWRVALAEAKRAAREYAAAVDDSLQD